MILFQLQPDTLLEINPYGTTAIGVLFALLVTAAVLLWKELGKKDAALRQEQQYGRETLEKVISLAIRVEDALGQDKISNATIVSAISAFTQEFKLLDQFLRHGSSPNPPKEQ